MKDEISQADASCRRPLYFSGGIVQWVQEHYWKRVLCSTVCKISVTPSNQEKMQER